ncbi:unnamed protein product [Adineta ricciae]|uniref:Matrin-type domain-containing protein n=1 Tax=Adineta ricciae TaxID=249248 RepID=A0A814CBX1_ADIRI|nr:unnamed protein product [Adineta ricciae]
MTNRGRFLNNRRANKNFNRNKKKTPLEDDSMSIICFKDPDTGHVGTVRIRQQIFCTLCNLIRGTLSLYFKHVMDDQHHEHVKKLCDENCFMPTVYDQAVHLGFYNNICYQTDKFHFRYKYAAEESDTIAQEMKTSVNNNASETNKMETNSTQPNIALSNTTKQRSIQVTLVFQDKTYSRTGTVLAQIREQLLKDMLVDRADDIAAIPIQFYYSKKKSTSDYIYDNIPNSSVTSPPAEEQSQVIRQQQQEPLSDDQMSSAECSRKDNGVTPTIAMTTHEISTAEKTHPNEQPSCDDDVMNVCKDVLNNILVDAYSKTDEYKRERELLFGIARRRYKKRKAFFCDICSTFLITEDLCTAHQNSEKHLEKVRHYQTELLPWRRAMQESFITGKPMKDIIGATAYADYRATMAYYLAPNSIHNHGRFCCAYCELTFFDQWLLEQHLNTSEHKKKKTSTKHRELVPHFADMTILPNVYRLNGVKDLAEVPANIKKEESWSSATLKQLDEDTNSFLQQFPFDEFEGVTRITNGKTPRNQGPPAVQTLPTQKAWKKDKAPAKYFPNKRGGLNRGNLGQPQPTVSQGGKAAKRSFPSTPVLNKRFRQDLNNSFPGANRGPGILRNYEPNAYNYAQTGPINNGNNRWPPAYSNNQQQQRQEYYQQRNFDTRSYPTNNNTNNNNAFYDNRNPQMRPNTNNYDNERQLRFNNGADPGYPNQQSSYSNSFNRSSTNFVNDYSTEPIPPNRLHQRGNSGPNNGFGYSNMNNHQRSQQLQQETARPSLTQTQYPNSNSFHGFGTHNSNTMNSSFFTPLNNQQPSPMPINGQSINSYADYRASSALPPANNPSTAYPPVRSLSNSTGPQNHMFTDFSRSNIEASNFNTSGHQSLMPPSYQTPWRDSSNGMNTARGRDNTFHHANKQSNSTFSHSNNNNNGMNSSARGRGSGQNTRFFGGRR